MGKDLKGKELGRNLSQRKDGRYEGKYTDNFGKRHSIYGRKLADVRKKLREALYDKEHNIYGADSELTLNEWFDIWTDTYFSKRVKPTTYGMAVDRYNKTVRNSKLGQMHLKNITNVHVQDFVNSFAAERPKLKRSSLKAYLSPMKEALRQAVDCGYIAVDPVTRIILPKGERNIREALTKREQELFLMFAEGSSYCDLFRFLLLTGLRCGEAFALTWTDIDFDNRSIDVNKTVSEIKGSRKEACKNMGYDIDKTSFFVTSPKTHASIRKVPMSDDCFELLNKMYMKRNRDTELVFHTKTNNYINHSNVDKRIKEICAVINERSGEKIKTISLHCLRHTFATRCFESGVSVKTVQALLGHSSIETTMDIYTHVTQELAFKEINKVKLN